MILPRGAEMYICSFLSANTKTNTNAFVKNKEIQIRVKILPKNVFENTKTNTFNLFMKFLIYYKVSFLVCFNVLTLEGPVLTF